MIQVKAFGNTFSSVTECCKHYNLDMAAFFRRLNKGMSIEDIILDLENREKIDNSGIEVEFRGVKYKSVHSACLELGLRNSRFAIRQRMLNGETFDEAVNSLLKYRETKSILRDEKDAKRKAVDVHKESLKIKLGETVYKSCNEACKQLNINQATVSYRMRKDGLNRKEALKQIWTERFT